MLDSLCDKADDVAPAETTLPRQGRSERRETEVSDPPPAPAKQPAPAFRWYYVLTACVVVVLGVVFIVTRQVDDPVESTLSNAPPPTPVPESPAEPLPEASPPPPQQQEFIVPPDVGQELVEAFVARQDWRQQSLLEFLDSWSRLPEADRIVAKGAMWFEPLSRGLVYKIEESLEFATDPERDEQLNALYGFSLGLGLVELVPAGWNPDPKDINRGADRIAPAETAPEAVAADTTVEEIAEEAAEAEVATATPESAVIAVETEQVREETDMPVRPENENACDSAQLETRRRNCFDLLSNGENGPLMRVLPAGEFTFGNDGTPAEIPTPFAMSVFEVKAAEFRQYCEAAGFPCPAEPWSEDDMPVVDISWHQAVAYSQWLSAETGYNYRLPTDVEWEYAARAGTETPYPYGDRLLPAQARYSSIAEYDSPLPASDRTTMRNEFGLWHVIGNVREWVASDGSAQGTKIVRGGSYASNEDELRSASKLEMPANDKDSRTGFRLLREL